MIQSISMTFHSPLPQHVRMRATQSLVYLALAGGIILLLSAVYQGGVYIAHMNPKETRLADLPLALGLSFLRMAAAYIVSLIFGFAFGLLAARTSWGERVILPLIDILQSVPVVGFFPAAIAFFISITNEHRLGIELAAVFLIFTSQAWNLAFAVYESVKSIPDDQMHVIDSFGIHGSARFWKLYGPATIPRLIYNSMLSWSNGWFFLVACEIIAVGPLQYHLPGIGSFLALAAEHDQIGMILAGLGLLTALILALDFLIWRPASHWSRRFLQDQTNDDTDDEPIPEVPISQVILDPFYLIRKPLSLLLQALLFPVLWIVREIFLPLFWDVPLSLLETAFHELNKKRISVPKRFQLSEEPGIGLIDVTLLLGLIAALVYVGFNIIALFATPLPEIVWEIPLAILASTGRLILAIFICLAWILPLIYFTWNQPHMRRNLTTLAQVGASLPAIALFPLIVVIAVKKLGGGMELASIVLLLTGMQWYILFNCLGGASTIPGDLIQASRSFGLGKIKTWQRLVFPSISPALVTGAITAWGGGWNALIVAEYVVYKKNILQVNGIGALLSKSVYETGDHRSIMICLFAMVAWILLINQIFWRPLYQKTIERFKMEL